MNQYRFNPADYCFSWTEDGWYTWDSEEAHRQARQARDSAARTMQGSGLVLRKGSSPGQLVTRGGIGTPHPEVTLPVTVYYLEVT